MADDLRELEELVTNLELLTEKQLRDILQAESLDTTGEKKELFDRVRDYLRANRQRRLTIFALDKSGESENSGKSPGNASGDSDSTVKAGTQNLSTDLTSLGTPQQYSTPQGVDQQVTPSGANTQFQFPSVPGNYHLPAVDPSVFDQYHSPLSLTDSSGDSTSTGRTNITESSSTTIPTDTGNGAIPKQMASNNDIVNPDSTPRIKMSDALREQLIARNLLPANTAPADAQQQAQQQSQQQTPGHQPGQPDTGTLQLPAQPDNLPNSDLPQGIPRLSQEENNNLLQTLSQQLAQFGVIIQNQVAQTQNLNISKNNPHQSNPSGNIGQFQNVTQQPYQPQNVNITEVVPQQPN